MTMTPQTLKDLLKSITAQIAGRPLDPSLQTWLNEHFGHTSPAFQQLKKTCETGAMDGWLCQREAAGVKYGRIFKADDGLDRFSVDVVDMTSLAGPHHQHPLGEIDLILPLDSAAEFDGHGAGWLVYGPGTSHAPTVTLGRSLVLYLLPEGRIEFSR
jgi:hypothetical protein